MSRHILYRGPFVKNGKIPKNDNFRAAARPGSVGVVISRNAENAENAEYAENGESGPPLGLLAQYVQNGQSVTAAK